LANGKFGVVVADAAGHGIGAAMQMTATRAFLHSSISNFQSPAKLMERINYYVTRDSGQTSRFVSLFFLEIDPQQKKLSWIRAGHEPGFLYDPTLDEFTELAGEGMALGVVANYDYQITTSHKWALGSVLVIATDGVYETRNGSNEMFGAQRLRQLIRQEAQMPAATIQDRILAALQEFRGTSRAEDDLTIIVIKLL
jgi:sigma-B regulation protein RsbU (phosphoserine phosphatase)